MSGLVAALLLLLPQASLPTATPSPRPEGPEVVLETSLGSITIGLFAQKAPRSVANFLEYLRAGHYDGTIFHRVVPGFVIQGGGLTPDLQEKPVRGPVRSEARNGLRNSRGTVALARTEDPDSAQAQFFINLRDNHRLDFGIDGAGYTVFGVVLEGMDVVDRIAAVPTGDQGVYENVPDEPVVILKAREVKAGP